MNPRTALTYEFLSSFAVINEHTLSFRIANVQHEISKSELADMFEWRLVEQESLPENYATLFWLKITQLSTSESYNTQQALSSKILSTCHRYFARVMSYTLFGRAESNNKIQMGELALLYYFDERLPVDCTTLLISRFLYQSKRPKGAIVMGGFVTRIAEKLGVFNRMTTHLPTANGWPSLINVEYLIGMRMLYRGLHEIRPVYHTRDSIRVPDYVPEPKRSLEDQVAELQRHQKQLLQKQENMETQLTNMFAYLQQHLSYLAP